MRKLPVKIKARFLSDRVSKILFSICILCLGFTLVSQLLLKNKNTREMFTDIEKYEKIQYASNEAFEKGSVVLCLENSKPSEQIEIWFNGEKIDSFKSNKHKIDVDCDGVIEVKNDSGKKIVVSVESVSDNTELLISNKHEINSGIRVVCFLRLKKIKPVPEY